VVLAVLGAAVWIERGWLRAAAADCYAANTVKLGQASLVAELGKVMMTKFVLPLEVVAVLLTAAMVGAIVIAMEEIVRRGRS
jgi:NADH-quinone oxidoreductase subunit J